MAIILYDGTFAGFLTVVFECYAQKLEPTTICKEDAFQGSLFSERLLIDTDMIKSKRVWDGLQKKLHPRNRELPMLAFLSEDEGIEMRLFRFLKRVFGAQKRIDTDYADADVLALKKIERLVQKEAMRVLQFVRFQQTRDDVYFAPIEPQFDVLPYAIKHFRERFADQKWLIYDLKRDYGFFYNLENVSEITLSEKSFSTYDGKLSESLIQEEEASYQALWKNYFTHINIEERKNSKLQRQQMPRRYWKFLPEKH
ncbi:TIGR03915 family putative DNA repair protein [Mangrovibacterium marinum]|uniref:Putative DNA metabolism protein n=1 Tax=Mangrovibacterium marinum TaxID=1639118 RepID=A0A2T5C3L2_9BACT|nr:TIGR03915 family putative DNA repair protein [Mangrovibacterium marinum]PTN09361.1 putative DNA metabolism protein [Mangrovibacterium marinum]